MGHLVNPIDSASVPGCPLSLDPRGSPNDSATISFDNPPWITNTDTLYIHFAMSSNPVASFTEFYVDDDDKRPTVWIKVLTDAGEGSQVELSYSPDASPEPLHSDASGSLGAILGYASITADEPVFKAQVADIANYRSIASWEIQIRNNADEALQVVWVAADSSIEAGQPWMEVSSSLDFGIIPVGETRSEPLSIANRGTASLNVTGASIPGSSGMFSVTTPDPIHPNSSENMIIHFNAPLDPGAFEAEVEIISDDQEHDDSCPLHNQPVDIAASCGFLEIVMVLDASGSMALTPDGSALAREEASRWDRLSDAATQFLELLPQFSDSLKNIGIVLFPDIDDPNRFEEATSVPLYHWDPSSDPIDDDLEGLGRLLSGCEPSGKTPLGRGIQVAMGLEADSFGLFQSDLDNIRWMVLMSDGAHNLDPPPPDYFRETDGASFQDKNIRVFAVAYGDAGEGDSWPPHEQMQNLAAAGVATENENYYVAGELYELHGEDAPGVLAKGFHNAIVTSLELGYIDDPTGRLTSGRPELRHPVNILPYDTRVAFVVNWNSHDQERVDVRLLTPFCELITPDLAAREAHVSYYGHSRYAIYTFRQDYLRNASDPGHPRYGQWTLVVTGHGLEDGDQEAYTYDVIVQSGLKMKPRFDRRRYWAGDPITVSVRLLLNGTPIPDATVSMDVEAPGEAAQNWIARQKVSAKDFEKAKEQLKGKDVTALDIKTHAVLQMENEFDPFIQTKRIIMADPSHQGVYSATFTSTTVPGNYKFHIKAVGQTPDRFLFRRERQIHQYVDVRPVAGYTFYHAGYRKIVDDNGKSLQIDIRVWPRDPFNNVALSPGDIHRRIALTVDDGKLIGPLEDNLDGSYSAVFRCDAEARPSIDLMVNGHEVFDKLRLLPVSRLHYADQILEYEPGPTVEGEGAAHDDPEAALGDVTLKSDDEFVHLGLYGRLTLGAKDLAVYAGEGDDVVVFVQPSEDRCDYRVEALPMGSGTQWVALGTSPGVTRAFGLGAVGIRAAEAIRIIDRSGRRTPGASGRNHGAGVAIRGMGFGKVGPLYEKNDGCLAWPLVLIRKLSGASR